MQRLFWTHRTVADNTANGADRFSQTNGLIKRPQKTVRVR